MTSAYTLYLEQFANFPSLNAPEEINVGELLHFVHICSLDHLLVIEQYPRGLVIQLFADESNIMASKLLVLCRPESRVKLTQYECWYPCGRQWTATGTVQGGERFPRAGLSCRPHLHLHPLQHHPDHQDG